MNCRRFPLILLLLLTLCLVTACTGIHTGISNQEVPLVAGYDNFSENFNPFFADTRQDLEVVNLTGVELLKTDRTGAVVYQGIKGETHPYNERNYTYTGIADLTINYDQHSDTTSYLWTIRDDIRFADGQPLTADDILFSYYIYCDPSYDGLSTISSLPILGLDNYLLQTPEDIYQKYAAMFDAAYNQGANYTIRTGDSFTQEQYALAWQLIDQAWQADLQSIIDFCLSDYLEQAKATPYTAEEITDAQNNLQVMYAMYLWSFGNLDQTGKLTGAYTGKTWNMTTDKPTLDDFLAEAKAAYGEDILAYSATETIAGEGVYSTAQKAFIRQAGTDETAAEAQNICISGIQKRSQTQVEITLAGYDAAAIYALNLCVAPLHYYGDSSKFDEQKGKFGFDFGDLSTVKAKTTQPLGAGPYKFVKYENKTVYFEANPYYYKGEPKIKYIQFKETPSGDRVSGITTGLIDITNPSFSAQTIAEISGYNSNSTLNGDKIATVTMDHLGYGYIGINAATVNVNGDPGSEASRNLRRGFATLFAAYRQLSIGSYFGEMAEVIDYPITAISWASPRKTDPAYQTAFSRDIQGNPIYSGNEDAETACRKALDAAIAYFKAADFTWDQKSGRFTAAPAGAKLEYEMVIPGEGVGDHPALILCTKAAEALATIGFNLIVTDPSDENALWDSMNANTQEFWCSARDCTIDPDLYQLYHSANIGIGNYANINDSMLDQLIMEARTSSDQDFRKATYQTCLDMILDWAVEIPLYQRKNCLIFSPERIELTTLTPDITTFWPWYNDIELLEMN